MQLSTRQETLLGLIIREYVDTTLPVSSNGIREKYGLPFSPATIRNEMTALTERGFIRQPHTSAGPIVQRSRIHPRIVRSSASPMQSCCLPNRSIRLPSNNSTPSSAILR